MKLRYKIICGLCHKEFKVEPHRLKRAKYCSRPCAQIGISRSSNKERADKIRGRGAGKSYIKYMGRHLHRIVAEEKLGRSLLKGEIVHHVDGNKRNNSPENLEVISQSDHIKIHHAEMIKIKSEKFKNETKRLSN